MTQIVLPNTNITGTNLWSQVEDNDQAILDVVNGDIGADNLASGAVTTAKVANGAITNAKLTLSTTTDSDSGSASINGSGQTASVPGIGITCAAGTWLITSFADVIFVGSGGTAGIYTYPDVTSDIYAIGYIAGHAGGTRLPVTLSRVITPSTSVIVKMAITASVGSVNARIEGGWIQATQIA